MALLEALKTAAPFVSLGSGLFGTLGARKEAERTQEGRREELAAAKRKEEIATAGTRDPFGIQTVYDKGTNVFETTAPGLDPLLDAIKSRTTTGEQARSSLANVARGQIEEPYETPTLPSIRSLLERQRANTDALMQAQYLPLLQGITQRIGNINQGAMREQQNELGKELALARGAEEPVGLQALKIRNDLLAGRNKYLMDTAGLLETGGQTVQVPGATSRGAITQAANVIPTQFTAGASPLAATLTGTSGAINQFEAAQRQADMAKRTNSLIQALAGRQLGNVAV